MRIVVFGAGGHSREVAEILQDTGHEIVMFIDDEGASTHDPTGIPVGRLGDVPDGIEGFVVAIGDCGVRQRVFEEFSRRWRPVAVLSASASLSRWAHVGEGVQATQNTVVNAGAHVGDNVILNVACVVSHNVAVGAHTHIAPGALLGGAASVGERCLIGAGAVILPSVRIGDGCIVGAGAVVTHDAPSGCTIVGVPARAVGSSGQA